MLKKIIILLSLTFFITSCETMGSVKRGLTGEKLENTDTNLEDSIEHYDRMIQLNHHIQDQFRKKSNEIRQSTSKQNKKSI